MSTTPGRYGPDGGAELYNAYVEEQADPEANVEKFPYKHLCRPGFTSFATLNGAGFRGAINLGTVTYVVNGFQVDKVDTAGTVTNVGSFVGTSYVDMARNRKSPDAQIAIVADGERAILEADVVTTIADTDLPPPVSVDAISGYFVFGISDGRYFWTTIDEGTAISALDYKEAEANPDGLIAVRARLQEIMLFGPESVEFHQLTGSSRTFERVQQATLSIGALARPAIIDVNGIPIFPASDGTVRMLQGYDPVRISTHAVERSIADLTDTSSLNAFNIPVEGHNFYVLNAPTQFTWVCDLLTQKWFKWNTYDLLRWAIAGAIRMSDNRVALFDYSAAAAYILDKDEATDAGEIILWKLISEAIGVFPGREIVDELYLDCLPAAGLASGNAEDIDPRIMLRTSIDDGNTWSDEMYQKVGKIGQYSRETKFRQLGVTGEDGMRFEIAMSAAVNRMLTRAMVRRTPLIP